jgi:hypothetical protein
MSFRLPVVALIIAAVNVARAITASAQEAPPICWE